MVDGSTVPYPPIESDIVGGYIETAGWSPMYLWLLVVTVILILLIIFVACVINRVKKRQQARSNSKEIQTKHTLLVSGAPKVQSPPPSATNGLILAYDNGVVLQTKTNTKNSKGNPRDIEYDETVLVQTNTSSRNLSAPITYYVNGETQSGKVNGGNHKPKTIMPPVERFERPEVRALDNHSAISLDEFWQKIGWHFVLYCTYCRKCKFM